MKYYSYLFISFFLSVKIFAGSVDTVSVFSNSMHKAIKCVVVKPSAYEDVGKQFPVVYLLHGYSGNYSNWITRVPELNNYVDRFNCIIVCPDGNYSSWYFDSPVDSAYRYETYIVFEVVTYIDSNYKTIANKAHRAITGLSMGGHGALFLGLRHSDIFGAAGSMSGVVDLYESKNKYDIGKRIGDTISHAKDWHNLSVINLIENYNNNNLKIIFDCGDEDIFINANRRLHEKMLQLQIPHQYTERPGKHNWNYWQNSISFQLLFFQHYFSTGN
ncbi:MAG TPA: alpha/beta hydrolase family protein [Ferruginibacter sp.]|nr:alpha/beta hydrolase family protein [Ferruginibacter sp.]